MWVVYIMYTYTTLGQVGRFLLEQFSELNCFSPFFIVIIYIEV